MKTKIVSAKIIHDFDILNAISQPDTRENGFRLLMTKYQEKLYWIIRHLVLSHHDADDVLQNTLIKVCNHIDKYERKAKLYTWLHRIAINEAITFINKKKKRVQLSIGVEIKQKLQADSFWDGDEAELKLQQAIAKLPHKQKVVFIMKYYQNYSYRDISKILHTSEGGLKANYFHAVNKIKKLLV